MTASAWAYLSRQGKCWSGTRLGNANIGMQEGDSRRCLWGFDDLIDSVKKHDKATKRIRERDAVKIKNKAIVIFSGQTWQERDLVCGFLKSSDVNYMKVLIFFFFIYRGCAIERPPGLRS